MSLSIKTRASDFWIVLLFAAASVFSLNQYRYGLDDHAIILPFLKKLLNSDLYQGDYIFGQTAYYYSFLWKAFARLLVLSHLTFSELFFISYLAAFFLILLALYLISMTLFQKREAAVLALFLLLGSQRGMAGIGLFENMLIPRFAVLPFLLFSLYFFLKRSFLAAFSLQGLGFLIHPQTTVFTTLLLGVTSVFRWRKIGIKKLSGGLAILVLLASPIFLWRFSESSESLAPFRASADWLNLMALRVPHHVYPSLWDPRDFVRGGLFILLFLISLKYRPRQEFHRTVTIWFLAVLALCGIYTVCIEFFPVPIVFTLRLFRSFSFLMFFTLLYFAHYFVNEIRSSRPLFEKLTVLLISMGLFYHARPFWPFFYGVFAGWALSLIVALRLARHVSSRSVIFSLSLVILLFGTGMYAARMATGRGPFSISDAQDAEWLDVQRWAKDHTEPQDLFIVPPTSMGFRVESERPLYGDWKDGQLLARDPAFGEEWFKRMKSLGFEKDWKEYSEERWIRNFRKLEKDDFLRIASEMKREGQRVYLVHFADRPPLALPTPYRNHQFVVYEVP